MFVHVFVSEYILDSVEIERSFPVNAETMHIFTFIMFGFKVICWALLFIFKLRFPPGVSIATVSYILYKLYNCKIIQSYMSGIFVHVQGCTTYTTKQPIERAHNFIQYIKI